MRHEWKAANREAAEGGLVYFFEEEGRDLSKM
jgi:hypothetical protein